MECSEFDNNDEKEMLFGKEKVVSVQFDDRSKSNEFFQYFHDSYDKITEMIYNMIRFNENNSKLNTQSNVEITEKNDNDLYDKQKESKELTDIKEKEINYEEINAEKNPNQESAPPIFHDEFETTPKKSIHKYNNEISSNSFEIDSNTSTPTKPKPELTRTPIEKKKKNLTRKIVYWIFLIYILLLGFDMYTKYNEKKSRIQNDILLWEKEYKINMCDEVDTTASKVLFEFCQDKKEKISNTKIYLSKLFSELIIENFNIFVNGLTVKSGILSLLIIIPLIIYF